MNMGEQASFYERISGPYLIKFNDELTACKDGITRLRKQWETLSPANRRRMMGEVKQHFRHALTTARASATNQRVRLDVYLETSKQRVRTKYIGRIMGLKKKYANQEAFLRTQIEIEHREYVFEKLQEQMVELERVMQPIMLLTPQNPGYDLFELSLQEVMNDSVENNIGIEYEAIPIPKKTKEEA